MPSKQVSGLGAAKAVILSKYKVVAGQVPSPQLQAPGPDPPSTAFQRLKKNTLP
jgi:hypothetical protein